MFFIGDLIDFPPNLALGKPTYMSSHVDDSTSEVAVDGSYRNTLVAHCSQTRPYRRYSFWKVDLEAAYDIERVAILHRKECCGERGKLH